jgi:predicted DNA repair protein MutK
MTAFVYGIVALIVKADDAGVALAKRRLVPVRLLGRGLVIGMPYFLNLLGAVGTIAMLWVGGGIIIHGFAGYGLVGLEHVIHDLATVSGRVAAMLAAAVEWLVTAGLSAVFGFLIGAVAVLAMHFGVTPLLKSLRKSAPKASLDGQPGA